MRVLTCSIVAAMAVSMVSASELADAFKNGKVSGAIQAYHFARDFDTGTDYDITTFNLDLSYETARLSNGLGAKFTFQGASSPWADEDAKAARSWDMYGSGGQLSEAYISYVNGNTSAKVGRMYFWSPVLGGSGSRPTKEAFQGVAVTNTDIPDTSVTLAYMNKFQSRTDGTGDIGNFTNYFEFASAPWGATMEDGAYTIAVTNKSIANVTLTAAYAEAIDVLDTAYFEAVYKQDTYGLAAQYYNSKMDAQSDRGYLFGVKGDVTYGSVNLLAAYTTTGDDVDVQPGIGNGADMAYAWTEILGSPYYADQDTYKVAATYNINSNAYVGAAYVEEDIAGTIENGYTAIKGSYTFSGVLKGLNIWAVYEMGSKDMNADGFRFKANYTF